MIRQLYNYPCVGLWVPFNEGWGQFDALRITEIVKKADPTRPVDHASGWFDQGGSTREAEMCAACTITSVL